MHTETPTLKLAILVWWVQLWRTMLFVILGSVAVGFTLAIVQRIIGVDLPPFISGIAGGIVGFIVVIKVIERLMTKGFGKYRLAVVKK